MYNFQTTTPKTVNNFEFELPPHLEASEPPEARGLQRDQVKLMVSHYGSDCIAHTQFRKIGCHLSAGDLLVINCSGTLNAALEARRADGTRLELHLSTHLPANLWSVELREPGENGTTPFYTALAGESLCLPGNGRVTLHTPHNSQHRSGSKQVRLWIASLQLPLPVHDYLAAFGFPIRYSYVNQAWPAAYYQTVFANELGSAEMPSAGRAFTTELITQLVAKGVQIAPLILHTGVASLEDHEPPYEEYYRVPAATAALVNRAQQQGKRIIAVGTTVIRALETVTDENKTTHAGSGWTDLLITPQRSIRSANGLLTGLHEPHATHFAMLQALTGRQHIKLTYQTALAHEYLWHEFGDLHLILP
ncbi:MAG: S-adenosylmethionine:tRNA ribosyltransferase-isomerase [Anaerolineales bacterium]|nr:S-adenosylmethionine:tRNA ribosyltransferase-isomerase [Anaerolineales bacterium]